MRETPISNNEKNFVLGCIKQNLRLDNRKFDEFRALKINFGTDYGSVHVTLGETRVLAQASCELGEPKLSRPNEGLLYINVELGPMAALNFEAGRNSELAIKVNRLLEKTFRDSGSVDLESLCIVSEDKVWVLRVHVNVLNHEGNVVDCASIATLCALAHFKRPDVTVSDDDIKIETSGEKDPIPIILHHYPVCISYAIFQNGEKAIADPTVLEEKTAEGFMVFGLNSHRELCCLNLGGTTLTNTDLLLKTSIKAAKQAKIFVDQVKEALAQDAEARSSGNVVSFAECIRVGKIASLTESRLVLKLDNFDLNVAKVKHEREEYHEQKADNLVETLSTDISVLHSSQPNVRWIPESFSSESNDSVEDDMRELEEAVTRGDRGLKQLISAIKPEISEEQNANIKTSSESEEETTMVLDQQEF